MLFYRVTLSRILLNIPEPQPPFNLKPGTIHHRGTEIHRETGRSAPEVRSQNGHHANPHSGKGLKSSTQEASKDLASGRAIGAKGTQTSKTSPMAGAVSGSGRASCAAGAGGGVRDWRTAHALRVWPSAGPDSPWRRRWRPPPFPPAEILSIPANPVILSKLRFTVPRLSLGGLRALREKTAVFSCISCFSW